MKSLLKIIFWVSLGASVLVLFIKLGFALIGDYVFLVIGVLCLSLLIWLERGPTEDKTVSRDTKRATHSKLDTKDFIESKKEAEWRKFLENWLRDSTQEDKVNRTHYEDQPNATHPKRDTKGASQPKT